MTSRLEVAEVETMETPRSTLSPKELAAAMREGFDARRRVRDNTVSVADSSAISAENLAELLSPLSGLVGMPAPPGRGIPGKIVRVVRQVLRKLLAPWLDQQTRFNHTLISELAARLNATQRQLNAVSARLQKLERDFPEACASLDGRVNECFHDIHALRNGTGDSR